MDSSLSQSLGTERVGPAATRTRDQLVGEPMQQCAYWLFGLEEALFQGAAFDVELLLGIPQAQLFEMLFWPLWHNRQKVGQYCPALVHGELLQNDLGQCQRVE